MLSFLLLQGPPDAPSVASGALSCVYLESLAFGWLGMKDYKAPENLLFHFCYLES